jgi:DNA-binding transcriptional ArsR family regulator
MGATSETITTETALRALAKPERREIIDRLAATSEDTTLRELGAALDAMDATPRDEFVALHHVHLPLLRDADIVEYDTDRRTVRRGPQFETVLSLLRLVEAHEETHPRSQS